MSDDEDLTAKLVGTSTWLLMKMMLTDSIISMTDGREKTKLLEFMAAHWSGHAPREIEMDTLETKLARAHRDYERLKSIPESTKVQKKCGECGGAMTIVAICRVCGKK